MSPLATGVVVVAVVALLALLMRRFSGGGEESGMLSGAEPGADAGPGPETAAEDESLDEAESTEVLVVDSNGTTFVPFAHGIELLGPAAPEEPGEEPAVPRPVASLLRRGDLVAARLRRGTPGVEPWWLEALGRDHDFKCWVFETEEAARAALEMVERVVVVPPLDDEGEPARYGAEAFAQARREYDRSVEEFSTSLDEDGPEREEPREPR